MATGPDWRAQMTVLLVDDDLRERSVLVPRLAGLGGRVIEAGDAEQALALCADHSVDLVVASARLGGIGAEALVVELRRRGGPSVIAYRLGVDPDAHIRWLESGGADCMSGDDPVLLAARCRAVLRRVRPRPLPPPSTWQHHVGR